MQAFRSFLLSSNNEIAQTWHLQRFHPPLVLHRIPRRRLVTQDERIRQPQVYFSTFRAMLSFHRGTTVWICLVWQCGEAGCRRNRCRLLRIVFCLGQLTWSSERRRNHRRWTQDCTRCRSDIKWRSIYGSLHVNMLHVWLVAWCTHVHVHAWCSKCKDIHASAVQM